MQHLIVTSKITSKHIKFFPLEYCESDINSKKLYICVITLILLESGTVLLKYLPLTDSNFRQTATIKRRIHFRH